MDSSTYINPGTPVTSAAHAIEAHNRSFAPKPPVFSSKEDERGFLKFRLAQAFRIFGKDPTV